MNYRGGPIPKKTATAKAAAGSIMCRANGCPHRWSVSPGHLCSLHAWAEPRDWPNITASEIARIAGQREITA